MKKLKTKQNKKQCILKKTPKYFVEVATGLGFVVEVNVSVASYTAHINM